MFLSKDGYTIGDLYGNSKRVLDTPSFPSEMGMRHHNSSRFPFAIIQCGKDADLMNVLARLRDAFDGLPSALATSSE